MLQTDSGYKKYAGFWLRFFAATIDKIVEAVVLLGAMFGYLQLYDYLGFSEVCYGERVLFAVFFLIVVCGSIRALFITSNLQATPGKVLFSLKVVDTNDKKIKSFFRAYFRETSFIFLRLLISIIITYYANVYIEGTESEELINDRTIILEGILILWFLPIAFTPEKTAIHDVIFNTRVVHDIYAKKT
jgi:uncharacterized RDD family membrane protein YckC